MIYYIFGYKKTSVATIRITLGTGKIFFSKKISNTRCVHIFKQIPLLGYLTFFLPLFNININVRGGGIVTQLNAIIYGFFKFYSLLHIILFKDLKQLNY